MNGIRALVIVVAVLGAAAQMPHAQGSDALDAGRTSPRLAPTVHPALPDDPLQYRLVPDPVLIRGASGERGDSQALANFARAARLVTGGQPAAGLSLIDTAALSSTPLAAYGYYYSGVALVALNRYPEAETAFAAAIARKPAGFLEEALPVRRADLAVARGDAGRAVDWLRDLTRRTLSAPEDVWLQLGRTAEKAGNRETALQAYRRVYYDYPLSEQANDAQSGLERLQTVETLPPDRFMLELRRAETLFAAKRWAQARAGFTTLTAAAQGDDATLVALRIGECDYYLDRFRAARDAMRPYLNDGSRQEEARFFFLTATRGLGDLPAYVTLARAFVGDFPTGSWTEETLNNLASHYIIVGQDDEADAVFRDLYQRFPRSRYAERAAWKIGWRAYRANDVRETAEVFEHAAADFPRADNRPAWLYWSGRARDRLGDQAIANSRYRLVVADYENSYYGRLASDILTSRHEPLAIETVAVSTAPAAPAAIPSDTLIRTLGSLGLYDDALREVQYAQRVWGDSAQLQATTAWIRHNQGIGLSGTERFNALRGAITIMRRAYPQFMAAGGEDLPPDVLRIIFPLDFWPLITKYSAQHQLDPYLMAALIAQESTFTPEIKSSANAYGLMQLIPSAGRQYARKVGLRYSLSLLTTPESNIRMGMQYFKDLVDRFGGVHYALASYNAGPQRVAQWRADRPGLPQDEFVDDIPFPETQNYVKRILGTAEDYRHLYGDGLLDPNAPLAGIAAAAAVRTPVAERASTASSTTSTAKAKPVAKPKPKAKPKPAAPKAKKKAAPKKTTAKPASRR